MSPNFREQLSGRGWTEPFDLVNSDEANALFLITMKSIRLFLPPRSMVPDLPVDAFVCRPWFKSMHAVLGDVAAIAAHPRLVEAVKGLLGPNIIVWGCTIMRKRPSEIHRWHVDVEHVRWKGLTAFIMLDGATPGRSGLKFVDFSNHFQETPQDLNLTSEYDIITYSTSLDPRANISEPLVGTGQCVLFNGRTWHSSHNSTDIIRTALIVQYTTPDSEVTIPLNWNEPVSWHPYRPPCILVAGDDHFGCNNIIGRKTVNATSSLDYI